MEPVMIRDPAEAFLDHWIEPEDIPLGDEFKKGGEWYHYAPIMETIYRIMAPKVQTQQWVKMATEVIIPFIKECDDIYDQEQEDFIALFRKYHGPGNLREKNITKAAEMMSQLAKEDPVLASIIHNHKRVIICERNLATFKDGNATITYNDGKYKDYAEAARLDPFSQMEKPKMPGAYKPQKEALDWKHPRQEPGDNLEMKRPLFYIQQKLRKQNPEEAELFRNRPLPWIETTYEERIREPRSLSEIQYDIQTPSWGGYGATAFLKDMHLLFMNARRFYGRDSHEAKCADKLERELMKIMAADLGDDSKKMLDLYEEIVTQVIKADPESAPYARPIDMSDAVVPSLSEDATDPTSPPAGTTSATASNLSQIEGQGESEDDEGPISAKGRRLLNRKNRAPDGDSDQRKVFKIREAGCSVAEYEERRLAYEADFDNKRARSDDDTEDENLWEPRKRARLSPTPADAATPARFESSQAQPAPAKSSPAQSAVESSSTLQPASNASSSIAQPANSSSSRSQKRKLAETDFEDEDPAQAKRQKIAEATAPQPPDSPPSATNLGFATKHSPIKIETLAKYNAARRSWLFAHRSDQGLGVYSLKCPRKACRHAFKQNPLLDNRARDHFQQCGHIFDDDLTMLQECAQQLVNTSNDRRFTIDWMRDVYNASIIKSSADKPRLEMENFPPIM